jgi:hypothetical protein
MRSDSTGAIGPVGEDPTWHHGRRKKCGCSKRRPSSTETGGVYAKSMVERAMPRKACFEDSRRVILFRTQNYPSLWRHWKRAEEVDPAGLECVLNQSKPGNGGRSKKGADKFGAAGVAVLVVKPGHFFFYNDQSDKVHLQKLRDSVPNEYHKVASMSQRKGDAIAADQATTKQRRALRRSGASETVHLRDATLRRQGLQAQGIGHRHSAEKK